MFQTSDQNVSVKICDTLEIHVTEVQNGYINGEIVLEDGD